MNLTIGYITSRYNPCLEWFFDSLLLQKAPDDKIRVVVVDGNQDSLSEHEYRGSQFTRMPPKPNIWSGQHRVTKDQWWSASNARNTAICVCQTEWIAFIDDRCVLMPGWLDCIREAMRHGYAVFGSYEKRTGITVRKGVIQHAGIVTGEDSRVGNATGVIRAPGEWAFGCSLALPLEWALTVNGYDETCDGLSMEDVIFGLMLQNNSYPLMYDRRMKMIEDRTPGQCDPIMRREDKGVSPNDKSHAMLNMLRWRKSALHTWSPGLNLRQLRESVLNGGSFPVPEKKDYLDWYDNTLINERTEP